MKHGKIIETFPMVMTLSRQKLPLWASKKVFALRKQMQPAWEFRGEEERKMLEEMQPEQLENGGLKFRTDEDANEWAARVREMNELEEDVQGIELSMKDGIEKLDIFSGEDIERLQGVVDFIN